MKSLLLGATALLLAGGAVAQPAPEPPQGHPVCLRPFDTPGPGGLIHTHVVDPRTILFYMPNGKVWVNHLKSQCRGLMFHGFEYVTHEDEICSNQTAIRVIESGEICKLGDFVPYMQHAAR